MEASTVRFAQFNASLNRSAAGQLIENLSTPSDTQAQAVAEIIQRSNPDVLLINEFDFDAEGQAAALFQKNYLSISQNGVDPVVYPYAYVAPSNTGISSGADLDNSGGVDDFAPNDAFGFGFFEGQFSFAIFSKYPIVEEEIRTFQEFLWKDMPDALLPTDPEDVDGNGDRANWYTAEELEVVRLSSKNHVDLPIEVNGEVIHVLASHPTPPVFDGPEDRNGTRNHDEIRFWSDYVQGADYIYDDNGTTGGLSAGARFVIMGDQNADPFDGDSVDAAILQLLNNPLVNTSVTPSSAGGSDAAIRQGGANATHLGDPALDTADFGFNPADSSSDLPPGNLRADYVLPSHNLEITDAQVFWPESSDPLFPLAEFPTSDHRLVYADVKIARPGASQNRRSVSQIEFLGEVQFPTGFTFAETEVGGLSGLTYDANRGTFYALADDRSSDARFYSLKIDLSDGALDDGDVVFTDVTQLKDRTGETFANGSLDPEGLALTSRGTLYVSSEGDANNLIDPFIREMSLQGEFVRELPVPAKYLPTADGSSGIRNNQAFESLTITPDQRYLYTATENALQQDGPRSSLEDASLSRILKYDLTTAEPVAEFVYEVAPIPTPPPQAGDFADNGLVELLAVDNNGTLLALERSFAVGFGNTIKLFEVQTQGALNVFAQPDLFRENELEDDGEILSPAPFEIDPAVTKRELLDVRADLGIAPDNLEAVAFGPKLADGRQSLIIASDNNFNANGQFTQFLAFAVDFNTTPAVLPVVETPYTIDGGSRTEFEPLNILLVNDDGYDAEGIEVMYDALIAAGHKVTLVAPKEQQSGRGTLLDVDTIFRQTEVVEFAPNQWFVDGSPVTTTLAGLGFILNGVEPDLVISGINEGENVGPIAISSGTVSAATTATRAGIPAIAVSAGTIRDASLNIDEAALDKAYDFSAEFIVDLVAQLSHNRQPGADLLPDGVGLNVNIPAVVENIEGVKLTKLDETGTLDLFVGELAPGVSTIRFTPGQALEPSEITVPDSEGQNFLADFVTVTPIDGDWTSGPNVRQQLSDRVTSAPEDATATPLNILLTNDDGFDAPGIEVIYNKLTAAGHNVTLVGPKEQQSGTGTVLDVDKIFRPLDITNVEGNKWFVDAGVRTTTWAGLDVVLDGVAPDLVISGINEGENIGPGGAVSSGTVSAAVTALLRDVPAIAISAGIDLADPERSATDTAYEQGADFVVDLIAKLQATQGDDAKILPDGEGLSINIPVRFPAGVTAPLGVSFTDASDITPFVIDFGALPESFGGGAGLRFIPFNLPADAEISPTSEGGQFLSGFITVTPIDGDWTATELQQETVEALLSATEPVLLGDSDDPAIWVNPVDGDQSIIIGTLKDGGLATFNLQGEVVQIIAPDEFGAQRFNNVDLLYDIEVPAFTPNGSFKTDLAVVSDRANDSLAIYRINPATGHLSDITLPLLGGINDPNFSIFGVDDGEATAYGLATYKSPVSGKAYVFVTQADGNRVAQLELVPGLSGGGEQFLPGAPALADAPYLEAKVVRTIELPTPTGDAEDSQSEGLVVDQELGLLYVALENEVGILKFSAEPEGGSDFTVIQPVGADYLVPDIEGLSIYYGENGSGYLIANSQGDSSYAVFSREGTNEYLGSFIAGANHLNSLGSIDQVNESDGLDIINIPVGSAFPNGLVVLQDGANDPQNVVEDGEELENNSTNFKFVPWESVAGAFENPLAIAPNGYDPRNPKPQSLVNGIASGDVTQDSAVLWARSTFLGDVTFEYSTSEDFSSITGTTTAAVTNINQPVKVEVANLDAGTEYFYRVTDAAGASESGRFLTPNELGEYNGLHFGVTGDWRGEIAPYPAIANVAEKELDFFVKHGDTIYADDDSPGLLNPDGTAKAQAESIEDYRAKHNEVYSQRFGENFWADVQASTSIYATIDDHEVTNDFAGGQTIGTDPRFQAAFPDDDPTALINDSTLFDNGLQVFQEFNPIRDEFYGATGDAVTEGERKLYRYNTFGNDAATFVLDTRSFRDPAIPVPVNPFDPQQVGATLAATFTPGRTLLGDIQLADLKADLLDAQAAGITWKFVMVPEPFQNLFPGINTDAWDGYNAERTELLKFIETNTIKDVVFVAADVHMTSVNNITYQEIPFGEHIATSTFEITTGAVAYEDPTGRFLGEIFTATDPSLRAFYDSLPIAPDSDDLPNDKDDFVKAAINSSLLAPLGYDPIGLNDNLPQAEGLIDATLLQGDYYVGHSSTWSEFEIDAVTQKLTVTTWGIDGYTEAELLANPGAIVNQIPKILSQFEVTPKGFTPDSGSGNGSGNGEEPSPTGDETLFGSSLAEIMDGRDGDDLIYGNGGRDTLVGGSGNDLIYGGAQADQILGGSGNDKIYANGGADVIDSGSGMDEIWLGGAGEATIILSTGAGFDFIANYQMGSTTLKGFAESELILKNGAQGAEIFKGDDKLAVVAWKTVSDLSGALVA